MAALIGTEEPSLGDEDSDELQQLLQSVAAGQISLTSALSALESDESGPIVVQPGPGKCSRGVQASAKPSTSTVAVATEALTPSRLPIAPPVTVGIPGSGGGDAVAAEAAQVRELQLKAVVKALSRLGAEVVDCASTLQASSREQLHSLVLSYCSPCSHLDLELSLLCATLQSSVGRLGPPSQDRPVKSPGALCFANSQVSAAYSKPQEKEVRELHSLAKSSPRHQGAAGTFIPLKVPQLRGRAVTPSAEAPTPEASSPQLRQEPKETQTLSAAAPVLEERAAPEKAADARAADSDKTTKAAAASKAPKESDKTTGAAAASEESDKTMGAAAASEESDKTMGAAAASEAPKDSDKTTEAAEASEAPKDNATTTAAEEAESVASSTSSPTDSEATGTTKKPGTLFHAAPKAPEELAEGSREERDASSHVRSRAGSIQHGRNEPLKEKAAAESRAGSILFK